MVETVVPCECGFEARGVSEDELVAAITRHALDAHRMALTRDEAAQLVARATVSGHPAPRAKEKR